MAEARTWTFYRLAHRHPPELRDYRTRLDKQGEPVADATELERIMWFGLSAFLTEDAARAQGRRFPPLGRLIIRYHIPEGAGITWRQTTKNRQHFDLRGDERADRDIVERRRQFDPFLDRGYVSEVEPLGSHGMQP